MTDCDHNFSNGDFNNDGVNGVTHNDDDKGNIRPIAMIMMIVLI